MKKLLSSLILLCAIGVVAATYPNRWTTNSDATSINGATLTNIPLSGLQVTLRANRFTTNLDATSINGATLTNVPLTGVVVTNNPGLPGLVVGNGIGTNILANPTNSASSLAPNFAGFGEFLLTTNASFTWLAPVGVDTGRTNGQYVVTHITNAAASTIDMTGPAGVYTNGTWNVTNGGWTTISWHTYAGMITNALAVPIR